MVVPAGWWGASAQLYPPAQASLASFSEHQAQGRRDRVEHPSHYLPPPPGPHQPRPNPVSSKAESQPDPVPIPPLHDQVREEVAARP